MATQNSTNTSIQVSSISGAISYPFQPLVIATLSASVPNVTGDGTDYQVIFDSIISNIGSSYSSSTGVFTAAEDGNYLVITSLTLNGIVSGNADSRITVNVQSLQSNFNYGNAFSNQASGVLGLSAQFIAKMDATNTLSVVVNVAGGAKGVGLYNPNNQWCTLSIYKLS